MAKQTAWQMGLSSTSAGRFGGWADRYVHRVNGFLGLAAGVNDLYMESDLAIHLGRYEPGEPFLTDTQADWVCRTHTLTGRDGKRLATIRQSLLSPGVQFDVAQSRFLWFSDRSCQIMSFWYPAGKTIQPYSAVLNYEQPITEPWVLAMAQHHKRGLAIPLLLVFQHRPRRVRNINNDYHEFHFSGRAGAVVVMPLLGPVRLEARQLRQWRQALPEEIIQKCRFWARALLAYPVGCEEHFQIDADAARVRIRNRTRYAQGRNDWNWQAERLTPVPPLIALAAEEGFPIRFEPAPAATGLLTYYGPYKFAQGEELIYSLPLTPQLEQAVAPVRILNCAPAGELTERLRQYIPEPTVTFGGDSTYDINNIQDVLHDMRILAWATWSLDEPDRRANAQAMLKRLGAFKRGNYRRFPDPATGRSFIGEKEIWKTQGDVTFDYEWYNGMQLAGLWAGYYFLGQPEQTLRFIRKRWDLVEELAEYFRLTNDWATATFWTDIPGEFMWFDGWNFGWQGLIGLYRLAKAAGKRDTADQAAYLVSKSAVSRWVTWLMNDYVSRAMEQGLTMRGAGGPHDNKTQDMDSQLVGGFLEREGFAMSTTYAAGNSLGYMVPELYLFYRDEPRIVERLRRGQDIHLPRELPDWNRRPEFGRGKGYLYPSHWHFYLLDDQLFVRSIVLRRPMEELLQLANGENLSGPVMETDLLAGAPMVILPTDAAFAGNVYDAGAKTLTVRLHAPTEGLELRIVWPEPPRKVQGARRKSRRGDTLTLALPAGEVELRVQY